MPIPGWMQGRSLISSSLDPLHPVLVATLGAGTIVTERGREIDSSRAGPPFFALGGLGAIICDRSFLWRLQTNTLVAGVVASHTAPCDTNQTPALGAIRLQLWEHLAENGYDVSSLDLQPSPRLQRSLEIEQQILNLAEELQSRGMEKPQIQERAWEVFGARVIVLFNERDKNEPLPRWMTEVIDWAFENGKVLYDPPGPNSRLREISN
jgi:hypothetical protein